MPPFCSCSPMRSLRRRLDGAHCAAAEQRSLTASLAYARCLRAHGVPHPNPDQRGDFSLIPAVLEEMRVCIRGFGYEVGPPEVRNLSRGRAFFGFKRVPGDAPPPGSAAQTRYLRDLHACEKRVGLARRISKIIDEDRSLPKPGDL